MDKSGDKVYKGQTAKGRIGQRGEDIACAFLVKHGYTIISRNYWKKWGEIDIVASKETGQGSDLRFVEVKTVVRDNPHLARAGGDDYEPEDNMHPWKRQRLRRVIETYLLEQEENSAKTGWDEDKVEWQVDAISVYLDREGNEVKLEWLEDVVL